MNICIVIPNYNHAHLIDGVLQQIEPYQIPTIIVNDGSGPADNVKLAELAQRYSWLRILTLPTNKGKGGAVIAGLKHGYALHFTHALQIDADGQHDLSDIPKFLTAAREHPHALIAGAPLYDKSAPKSRVYGRRITNFWITIETLSRDIKDAMCGFRIYPLESTIPILAQKNIGQRMDFDIEIIVRLYWRGCRVISINTHVIYPENGSSHFRMLDDNLKISWMHTKLVFAMLPRFPHLLYRNIQRARMRQQNKPWFKIKEKGAIFGLKFMLYSYKIMGRSVATYLLYPIVAYYYWFSASSRKASKTYLLQLIKASDDVDHTKLSSFSHFLCFAQSALDKLSVWNGDIKTEQIDFINAQSLRQRVIEKKGTIIITAHLGNIEIARALSRFEPNVKVNALVFSSNARKFNTILEKVNPQCRLNMIEVNHTDIQLAMELKQKIDDGELIVIVADRTSTTNPGRCTKARFLQKTAHFPQGPFILAGLMRCPVYTMLCVKQPKTNSFKIIFENFAESIDIQRKNRQQNLAQYTQRYADILSKYCKLYPLQWFNFFNFWSDP